MSAEMPQEPPAEPTNHCDACGLDFFYAPELHVCRTRPHVRGESWVDECVRRCMS